MPLASSVGMQQEYCYEPRQRGNWAETGSLIYIPLFLFAFCRRICIFIVITTSLCVLVWWPKLFLSNFRQESRECAHRAAPEVGINYLPWQFVFSPLLLTRENNNSGERAPLLIYNMRDIQSMYAVLHYGGETMRYYLKSGAFRNIYQFSRRKNWRSPPSLSVKNPASREIIAISFTFFNVRMHILWKVTPCKQRFSSFYYLWPFYSPHGEIILLLLFN